MSKYKYQSPINRGYIKLNLTKKEIEKLVRRYNKKIRYEIYENDNIYLVHEFNPWWIMSLNIILYPILLIVYGLSNFKQLNKEIYGEMFQKRTGSFISHTIKKDKKNQDSINETLNLIK